MKQTKRSLCILFMALLPLLYGTVIHGSESKDADRTLSPYFLIEQTGADTGQSADQFPLKSTDVTANVNGVIAETFVTQTYINEGSSPINASYIFPASSKAAVHGMTMQIGDRIVTATIRAKEKAREEFEKAKSEGKSASLMEEQRPNVFSMDVANVMPGDTVVIELHYTELLTPTDGTYQYVFPTVVGPRYDGPSIEKGMKEETALSMPYLNNGTTQTEKYDITVNLSTAVPINGLICDSHKTDVNWLQKNSASVTLANPKEYAGNRDYILNYRLNGQDTQCGLMLTSTESENFFMMTVQPPEQFTQEQLPVREYIFVLDVSGSMYGYPLDTAESLINSLVSGLREEDLFNLILFSGDSAQMAPTSVPATAANIKKARDMIAQESSGGATELAPALETALSLPRDQDLSRNVVIITDGYISGEKEIFSIVNNNLENTNFFSFGIGSSVNRYLIEGIAACGQGESFVVTDSSYAQAVAERFEEYIKSPLLTDIQITYDGFDVYDVQPSHLSTLFSQKPIVLLGKWKGEPTGTIHISGKTADGEFTQAIQVAASVPSEDNSAIRYLWARKKVEMLSDYNTSDDQDAIEKEVTALGLKYSMITPYTSFIAVIDTIRNHDGKADDVKQPLPLPLGVSDLAVGNGYTVGSEPGDLLFLFLLTCVILLTAVHHRKRAHTIDETIR